MHGGKMNIADEKNEKSVEETPAEPAAEEKPAETPAEKAEETVEVKSGSQPRSTEPQTPTECATCGKALLKKLWYYRNGAFYCTKRCYKRKAQDEKKKAEEEKSKAEEEKGEE